MEVDAEIVSPRRYRTARGAALHFRPLGLLGALLAGGTALSALAVMGLFLFGRVLLLSAVVTLVWPVVFSEPFTLWVFGAPTISFIKVLILFALAELLAGWIRKGAGR